jgi:hypothetical protein
LIALFALIWIIFRAATQSITIDEAEAYRVFVRGGLRLVSGQQ